MHSRVCSSTMEQILIGRPCSSESNGKSTAHTTFGATAAGASMVEDPTRLRRRRCGTRRPSSRHSRWIFLWLTVQPSPRASWYARRYPHLGCFFAYPRSQFRRA